MELENSSLIALGDFARNFRYLGTSLKIKIEIGGDFAKKEKEKSDG